MAGATTLAIAALATAAASGAASAYGAHQQGQAASRAASAQQEQLRRKAMNEFALAQGRAKEERRQAKLLQSNAIARAASSGGGVFDKSTADIVADIGVRGEYNAMSQLYEGEARKDDLLYQGALERYKGQQARRAGNMGAFTTALDTASSIASMGAQYGKGSGTASKGKVK